MATQLHSIVYSIQNRRIIHNNINLSHILYSTSTSKVNITGFSHSFLVAEEADKYSLSKWFEHENQAVTLCIEALFRHCGLPPPVQGLLRLTASGIARCDSIE